ESSRWTLESRTAAAIPLGEYDWAFRLTARTTSAPTASPIPSHSNRLMILSFSPGSVLINHAAAGGPDAAPAGFAGLPAPPPAAPGGPRPGASRNPAPPP